MSRKLLTDAAFLPLCSQENQPFVNGSSVSNWRGRGTAQCSAFLSVPSLPAETRALPSQNSKFRSQIETEILCCLPLALKGARPDFLQAPACHWALPPPRARGALGLPAHRTSPPWGILTRGRRWLCLCCGVRRAVGARSLATFKPPCDMATPRRPRARAHGSDPEGAWRGPTPTKGGVVQKVTGTCFFAGLLNNAENEYFLIQQLLHVTPAPKL